MDSKEKIAYGFNKLKDHLNMRSSKMGANIIEVKSVPDECPAIYNLNGNAESCMKCVNIKNKGQGMIAIRNIMEGEIIIKDKATITIPDINDWPPRVKEEFNKLSPDTQTKILGLSNSYPDIFISGQKVSSRGLLGIYLTNSVFEDKKCMLFLQFSKFNHSCNYNVEHAYYHPFLILTAKRNIMKDEELCITYLRKWHLERKTKYRQNKLFEWFNFICKCERCITGTNNFNYGTKNDNTSQVERLMITNNTTRRRNSDIIETENIKENFLSFKTLKKIILILLICNLVCLLIPCTSCLSLFTKC